VHDKPLWLFPLLLGIILIYDVPWLIINWFNDTFYLIKIWTFVNLLTLIAGLAFYFGFERAGLNQAHSEEIALSFVLIVSLIDIGGIITGKQLFVAGLQRLTSRKPKNPPQT
jgi:hypothetical protein